jgi:hypothetical protein
VQADRFWSRLTDPVQAKQMLTRARHEVQHATERAEAAGRRDAAERARCRRYAKRARARAGTSRIEDDPSCCSISRELAVLSKLLEEDRLGRYPRCSGESC